MDGTDFPTAEEAAGLDAAGLRDLLTKSGMAGEPLALALFEAGLDGNALKKFVKSDYVALKEEDGVEELSPVSIRMLLKLKETIFGTSSEATGHPSTPSPNSRKGETAAGIQISNDDGKTKVKLKQQQKRRQQQQQQQQPRSFLTSVGDIFYVRGRVLPQESSSPSLHDPAREYKVFDHFYGQGAPDLSGDSDARARHQAALVKKWGRFLVGCLNARLNGVIALGVADKKDGRGMSHGEVVGLKLTANDRDTLQAILDDNFTGSAPRRFKSSRVERRVAQQCIQQSLKFIPVVGMDSDDVKQADHFVVELEVQPLADLCQEMSFFLDSAPDNKGKTERLFYFREGTENMLYKNLKELGDKVAAAAVRRDIFEAELKAGKNTMESRLDVHLSLGRSSGFPNENCKYVLVCSHLNKLEKRFSWISNFDWFLMLDLGKKDGDFSPVTDLCHLYQQGRTREITAVTGEELHQSWGKRDSLDSLMIGHKTVHISCAPSKDGFEAWYQTVFSTLSKLIHAAFNESYMEHVERVVVVSLVDEAECQAEISEVLKAFWQVQVGMIVCLFEDIATITDISGQMQRVDSRWAEKAFLCDWNHLSNFMKVKTEKKVFCGKTIPGSGGGNLVIEEKDLEYFRGHGINILVGNECQYVLEADSFAAKEFWLKAHTFIEDFLCGAEPEWPVFYLSEPSSVPLPKEARIPQGLVKRQLVDRVLDDIREAELSKTKPIGRVAVIHQPGSGATTVGRHVLWSLRKTRKCMEIDGKNCYQRGEIDRDRLATYAKLILNFRSYQEKADVARGNHLELSCPTVVVLFDNCIPQLANILTSLLQAECERRRITFRRAVVVVVCLYSSFETELRKNSSDFERGTKVQEKKHILEQSLSPEEKTLFQARLKTLEVDVDIKDMLSFVIVAEDFNTNSEYVKRVVQGILLDMGRMYPDQQTLLLFLSVLKFFGNVGLPRKHCELVAFKGLSKVSQIRKKDLGDVTKKFRSFCPQLVYFTRETTRSYYKSPSCKYKEINHVPVAFQLFTELSRGTDLSMTVKRLISEKTLTKERFLQDDIHGILVDLLTKRRPAASSRAARSAKSSPVMWSKVPRKTRFSPLIHEILDEESKEKAAEVLQAAYNMLVEVEAQEVHKSILAQSLARLHYWDVDDWDSLQEALKWAVKASEHSPERFTVVDTTGQVYKRMLQNLTRTQKKHGQFQLHQMEDVLITGKTACDSFWKAQKLYNEAIKRLTESDKENNKRIQEDEVYLPRNNYGLFGVIDSNLMVIKHLLETEELKETEGRNSFMRVLVGEVTPFVWAENYTEVLRSWKDHLNFVSGLYENTKECLYLLTRKMTYVDTLSYDRDQIELLENLEHYIDEVNSIFGSKNPVWRQQLERKNIDPEQKMNILRLFLAVGVANTFGWLSRLRIRNVDTKISDLQKIATTMATVSAEAKLPMSTRDKISYMNIKFAFDFHQMSRNCTLSEERVKDFCKRLVSDEAKFAEPYFFYLLLFWPDLNKSTPSDTFELLRGCISELKRFEKLQSESEQPPPPRFLFYLSQHWEDGRPKLSSAKNGKNFNNAFRYPGRLDENKNVVMSWGGGDQVAELTVRNINLAYKLKPYVRSVTFSLVFTFAGPVACFLTDDAQDVEMKRMEAKGKMK